MQPANLPPTRCPNCAEPILRDLFTGEPLEPTWTDQGPHRIFAWHHCTGPRKRKMPDPEPARNFLRRKYHRASFRAVEPEPAP